VDDIASVGLRVDGSQVRTASGDLDRFAGAGDRAGGSAGRAVGAFAGMGRGLAVAAASALAAVVSIAALSSQLNRFIDATVTNEKAQAQLGAAIASTGGAAGKSLQDLNAHAAALQKITAFGDETINAMQGVLLTFTQIKGDQFDAATAAILNVATAMGTDLKSAALQVGKALNDPVLGMTALSRSGIQFTEAQKEMVKGMVASNNVIGAQTIILAELERQFGGSAEAARNTLGGALASLRNAFGDLFELSGPASEGLRASIERLTKAVSDPAFFAAVQSIGTGLFAAAEMGVKAMSALAGIFTTVSESLTTLGAIVVVLAATQLPALIAAQGGVAIGMAAGSLAAYIYIAALKAVALATRAIVFLGGPLGVAIAVMGSVAAYFLLSKKEAQSFDTVMQSLGTTIGGLESVNSKLLGDYQSLKTAQDLLATAIATGGQAAVSAAALEVSAVRTRITANASLRQEKALLVKRELSDAKAALAAQEAETLISNTKLLLADKDFIARRTALRESGKGSFYGKIEEETQKFVAAQIAAGIAADSLGQDITDVQRTLLEQSVASAAAKEAIMAQSEAVRLLTQDAVDLTVPVAGVTTSLAEAGTAVFAAIPGFAALREEYGASALAAEKLLKVQNALAVSDFQAGIGSLITDVEALGSSLIGGATQAADLKSSLDNIGKLDGISKQADALLDLALHMGESVNGAQNLTGEARKTYDALVTASLAAAQLATEVDAAAGAAVTVADRVARIAANFGPAIDAAALLAAAMGSILGQIASAGANIAALIPGARAIASGMAGAATAVTSAAQSLGGGLFSTFKTAVTNMIGLGRESVKTGATIESLKKSADALFPALKGAGGAAGGAAATAMRDKISALEDAADPMRVYNRGMAELDKLKLAGLTDGAYALAVDELAKSMGTATTFAQGMGAALDGGTKSAVEMGLEFGGSLLRGIGSVSDAFGDFVMRGFKDFKGFVSSILSSFKSMLSQMISMAVRNRIMIGLGFSGGAGQAVAGGVAQAAGGAAGGAGGLLGGIATFAGSAFSGASGLVTSLFGAGGGLGAAGTYLSSVLGTATTSIGALGAAVGAIALPLLAVVAIFSFFKKKTKELDAGIMATVSGMETLVQTFRTVETKRFFGLSKKVRTSTDPADQETTDAITGVVSTLQNGVLASAAALGIAAGAFDNFAHTMTISTKGLSEEAANKAIQDGLIGVADAMAGMVGGLSQFALSGEGAAATLGRLGQSLVAVNGWMGNFRMNLYNVSLAGGGAAAAFVSLFGSLENFNAVSQSYYQNFFTDAERIARATELLSAEMLALGINALPSTRAAFRALVDEADALGDSDLVAALMQLSPAFAEISAGADALGDSLRSLVNEDLFSTGQDFVRALSRSGNGQSFTPRESDAELRAELRALNLNMERLISSAEITAGNTGRGADAADDTLAFTLEQTL